MNPATLRAFQSHSVFLIGNVNVVTNSVDLVERRYGLDITSNGDDISLEPILVLLHNVTEP